MKKESVFYNYIFNHRKTFIIILITFIIGLCFGIFYVNNAEAEKISEIKNYLGETVNNLKNKDGINKTELLIESLKKNLILILIIWILGCSIIGGIFIYVIIAYKGFTIGYTISSIIAYFSIQKGCLFVICGIVIQNVVFLPALFILAESGTRFFDEIKYKPINITKELIRYSIIAILIFVFGILASFAEVYISTNLLILISNIF